MYYYWGFGLNIASEIEFPELLPASLSVPDLVIKLGKIPADIQGGRVEKKDHTYAISDTTYFLDIRNVSKYYVPDMNNVIVEPYTGIDGRSVRIYLLATVMAFILQQKGMIPFHASGIIKEGGLILFAGDSGAGKSTTLAHLVSKGYKIFTDDVCVLQLSTGDNPVLMGVASYPMVKLWDDAIENLDNEAFGERTFRVRKDMDKFGQFFFDSFSTVAFPIRQIFIMKVGDTDEVVCRRLSGLDAFQQLERQAYRQHLIVNKELRILHFKKMSILAEHCTIYEVTRPRVGNVQQVTDILERLF